jgi:hypothetical protein
MHQLHSPAALAAALAPGFLAHQWLLCTHGCNAAAEADKEGFFRPARKTKPITA